MKPIVCKYVLIQNFLLALDSCAPFEAKLTKTTPARWITEAKKNEIKRNISCHEYRSIVDDAAKLQKKTEYNFKQQKIVVHKLIKKSKMSLYHELKNARTNPKDTWNLLRQLVPVKSKQNKCNFQNPAIISACTFNNFFCNSWGENAQRCKAEASDQWI